MGGGKWLLYGRKAGVWVEDTMEDSLMLATQSCLRHQEEHPDGNFQRLGFIKNALTLAKPMLAVHPGKFDEDPWVLNTPVGVIDLMEGSSKTTEDNRYLLQTRVAPRRIATPLWDKHLRDMTHGDEEVIGYLQRLVGMSLVGDQNLKPHLSPVLSGLGRNGKGVFTQALLWALGDYGAVSSSRLLTATEQAHTTEQKRLMGKRLVVIEEVKRINSSLFKTLTGGGFISARDIRENDVEFQKRWTFWFCVNGSIKWSGDTSDGLWERLSLIDLGEGIPAADRKDDWVEQLKTEAPGILQWAIDGCSWWQKEGLNEPVSVGMEKLDRRMDADPLTIFLNENYERVEEGLNVTASSLMRRYTEWCKVTGEAPPGGRNAVYNDLRERHKLHLRMGTGGMLRVYGLREKEVTFGELNEGNLTWE
jgi:putative DNA primase/helicase